MANNVDNHHPDYDVRVEEWALMRDAARGETAVKQADTTYLPMPSGFTKRIDKGVALYGAYQMRAQFPEIVGPTIGGMVGVIHRVEIQVEMPTAMDPLWEKATADGMPLEALAAKITGEILTTGRYALLASAPSAGGEPYISTYCTEALINWSEARDFYVLDESGLVRDGFDWVEDKQYRVLELVDGKYQVTVYTGDTLAAGDPLIPTAKGGKPLEEIPLVVVGPRDLSPSPETPPLIGVARAAVNMYQLSADYRWQLFMTGQETLFIINADEPEMVGAGVVVSLKADSEQTPDAKYVGPAGVGIDAHKVAITDERDAAAAAGAKLFDTASQAQESGDARRLRFAAQTATLVTIAQASSKALEQVLRHIAIMKGLDPTKVIVKPNLSFIDSTLTPAEVVQVIQGWQDGGYSYETMYERLQKGEAVNADRTAEEERKLIDEEDAASAASQEELGILPVPAVPGPAPKPGDPANPVPQPVPVA
ncbi:DUF4055 domain-containing protein [Mesorhizobium sp. M0058]|uniref:DUF4055 domain-containing protein n=1 Tax=Mesorhizobium sp. M0058 TaxID=2956865 RepID=UPI0033389C69